MIQKDEHTSAENETSEKVSLINTVAVTSYSGPLPHPEILARFEQLYPGAAKLIIENFLAESAQRRSAEAKLLPSAVFRLNLGAVSASILGLLGVGGGLWIAHEGRSLTGLSSALGTLATLLAVFLYQSRKH